MDELEPLSACRLPDADRWLRWWLDLGSWRQEQITLFGKRRKVPRLVTWYGDQGFNYRYSGTDHPCGGWPDALQALKEWAGEQYQCSYNFVLGNRYRSGEDSMGWHADDEPELLGDVCSVSLGAPRGLLLDAPQGRVKLELDHGCVIRIPRTWRHALPKTRRASGERINLTFRQLRAGR